MDADDAEPVFLANLREVDDVDDVWYGGCLREVRTGYDNIWFLFRKIA